MDKKLSEEVKKIIRNDIPLRKKIAEQLGIEPGTVYDYVARPKREKALTRYPITLTVLKEHTGMKESEILIAV
jgi:transposase